MAATHPMPDPIHLQPLSPSDLPRMREVDRTEHIAVRYDVVRSADGLCLSLVARVYDPPELFPNWDEEGVTRRLGFWQHELAGGGAVFGAFSGERLVGFSIIAKRRHGAEVLGMFVDAAHRRQSLGSRLLAAAEDYAREAGTFPIYLHPNPTASAIGFYRKHGYHLTCLAEEDTLNYLELETCIVLTKATP